MPTMPFGLFTLKDKEKIINTKKAKVGNIAIIGTDKKIGHVAVVIWVGSNHITIKEANFKAGKITQRHNTEKELKVLGYFNPEK
jgi:surface antigen